MGTELVKRGSGSGVVPGVASALLPGLGQLINGESDKAIGVFAVWVVAGAAFVTSLPLIGGAAAVIAGGTHLYGIIDGYFTGKRKR